MSCGRSDATGFVDTLEVVWVFGQKQDLAEDIYPGQMRELPLLIQMMLLVKSMVKMKEPWSQVPCSTHDLHCKSQSPLTLKTSFDQIRLIARARYSWDPFARSPVPDI